MEATSNRHAILWVDPFLLVEQAKHGSPYPVAVTEYAVPADARIVRCFTDDRRGTVGIVLESEEFAPVLFGSAIPELPSPSFRFLK